MHVIFYLLLKDVKGRNLFTKELKLKLYISRVGNSVYRQARTCSWFCEGRIHVLACCFYNLAILFDSEVNIGTMPVVQKNSDTPTRLPIEHLIKV